MYVIAIVSVLVMAVPWCFIKVMLMKMKQAQQQQHENQARNDPTHCEVNVGRLTQRRVRDKVKKGNAQHQSRDKAHSQLRAGVGHMKPSR
jgi:hypothetical protein